MRRLWLLPLSAALAACPPKVDTGADGGGPIDVGPSGGIFVRQGAVFQFPQGAVQTDTIIFVTAEDTGIPDVPNRARISLGFRLTPSEITFQQPITLFLPYLSDRFPAQGIDPSTFDMRRNTAQSPYEQLPGASTDTQHQVVNAASDRTGLFWVTSPLSPNVSTLSISPPSAFLQVGQTQQFTATVTDPAGNPLKNVTVAWSIVPARAASVSATGLVTALAPGNATLTATAGQQTATAQVLIQGSTPGPRTFAHDNPFPTGNDLFGGVMAPPGAFVVGKNGTVLGVNGSGTWTRYFSSPLVTLHAIAGTTTDAVAAGVGINAQGAVAGLVVELQNGATTPAVTTFDTSQPLALWYDGTYGMAVGTGNDVIVRQAGAWTTAYSPSLETLLSVVGDGAGAFVTVGSRGSIYRFDPGTKTWNSLFQNQLSVRLDGAFLVDATGAEAWGVGGNKLWHFLAGSWTAINLPGTPALTATTAIGAINGQIAVGGAAQNDGFLLLYTPTPPPDGGVADAGAVDSGVADGGAPDAGAPDAGQDAGSPPALWSSLPVRAPQIIRGIFGGSGGGYAVGDFGAVWQYDAGTFTEVSSGFYGDVSDLVVLGTTPVATVNVCAGGDAGCTAHVGQVMIRNGPGNWALLGDPQPFLGPLYGIAASSPSDVFVTGAGVAYHYDGNMWTQALLTGTGPIYDIELCGTTLNAVGASGSVYAGQGTLAPRLNLGGQDLHAVQCPSATDVWMAGDYSLYENASAVSSPKVNPALWRAVWSPGPSEAFAFGQSSYGVYWDSANMNVITYPGGLAPNNLPAMWGSSIDNLYLVGDTLVPIPTGYAVRFDGAQWSLVDVGAHRKATAISGSSNTEIWVGTEGGGLLRGQP